MSLRTLVVAVVLGISALGLFAWSRHTERVGPPGAGEAPGGSEIVVERGGDPGIRWTVPKRWTSEAGGPMRLATYGIPAAGGDREGARCAVYYFGPGQGGGVSDNIERWISEFETTRNPQRSTRSPGGLAVTTVRVRGTYLAHAGVGGGSSGPRQDHGLLGAIVEAPGGSVFVKLTGPARTVDAAVGEFEAMLASLEKK